MTSLAQRIFVALWATLILAIATTGGLIAWRTQIAFTATEPVTAVARNAAAALARGGRGELARWLAEENSARTLARVYVVDERGNELLGRTLPNRLQSHKDSTTLNLDGVLYLGGNRFPRLQDASGATYSVLSFPPSGSPAAAVLQPLPIALLVISLLVTTALISWLVANQLGQPLVDLKTAIDNHDLVESGQHMPAALSGRRDEIGALARGYTDFSQRLSNIANNQQKLFRDVSHELRSPISRMRLALVMASLTNSEKYDRIRKEIGRLEALIGPIIELNRLHSEAGKMLLQHVDLIQLVDTIGVDARFEAEQLGKSVVWTPADAPLLMYADPFWLSIAIENVVRNAIHAGPDGEPINVYLSSSTRTVTLQVEDCGPGVPASQLNDMFSPFHRNIGSKGAGFGVGLAIAARVVTLHKGRIYARNRSGKGLTVSIELPMA